MDIPPSPGTTDALVEGSTNLYFNESRVRNTVLTGLSLANSAVIGAADTVLSAFGKLQAQISLRAPLASPALTGNPTAPTPAAEDSDTSIATTAFIRAAMALFGVGATTATIVSDLDATNAGGIYRFNQPTTGSPGFDYGGLIVIGRGTTETIQIALSVSTNQLAWRPKVGSNWGVWREIWHTGNFNPASKQDKSSIVTTATSRTLALTDAWNLLRPATTGAITLTVPTNAAVAFEIGTEITIRSVGNITLASASGVVLEPQSGGTLNMTARMTVTLKKVATNEWIVVGQTVAA